MRARPPVPASRRPADRAHRPRRHRCRSTERFATSLDLDDKQKAEWEAAERETKAIVAPLILRMRTAQRQLDAAVKEGQPEDVVKERVDALAASSPRFAGRARTWSDG